MDKHYTISIKLYGKDGRKLEHKEIKMPMTGPDALYIYETMVKATNNAVLAKQEKP